MPSYELTSKQKELLPVYRDKWLKIGLSTEAGDKEVAEKAIFDAYKIVKLRAPQKIIWCDSPLSLAITDTAINGTSELSIKNQIVEMVRDSVWSLVFARIKGDDRTLLQNSIWESIRLLVKQSVAETIRASLWNNLYQTENAPAWASVESSVFGQQDAHWLGFYNYAYEVLKISKCRRLIPLMTLAQHCNWWIPRKDIVLASQKPTFCSLQDDEVVITYKDGFSTRTGSYDLIQLLKSEIISSMNSDVF